MSSEFISLIESSQDDELEQNTSQFYELCSKFADISLNAPKFANHKTCDIQGVFLFSDISIAKSALKAFVIEHKLRDIQGLLDAVRLMHRLAVAWDDPRVKSGVVYPERYDCQLGFIGKYHNYCDLPDDVWYRIENEIINEVQTE